MHRIDGADVDLLLPTPSVVGTPGYFRKADTTTQTRGTVVTNDWLNAVQGELVNFIEAAGITLSKASQTQLIAAVNAWTEIAALISDVADTNSITTTHTRVVVGSTSSRANGPNSFVAASDIGTAVGSQTATIGSFSGAAGGFESVIIGSSSCTATAGTGAKRVLAAADICTIGATTSTAAIVGASLCSLTGGFNKFIGGAVSCSIDGDNSALVGSFNNTTVDGSGSFAAACDDSHVSGFGSAAIAAESCSATGQKALVAASEGDTVGGANVVCAGNRSAIIASFGDAAGPTIIASGAVESIIAACDDSTIGATAVRTAVIASESSGVTTGDDCLIAASIDGLISTAGGQSAIIASEDVDITSSGIGNAILASIDDANSPTISGLAAAAAIVACIGAVNVTGQGSAAMACRTGLGTGPVVSGDASAAIASDGQFDVQTDNTMVVCSSGIAVATPVNATANSMVFLSSGGGTTPTLYQTIRLEAGPGVNPANHGDIYSDGFVGAGNADYAECFENEASGEISIGMLVTNAGRKAKVAGTGDRVLGVVSAKPAVVGNAAPLHWQGLLERDAWNRTLPTVVDCVSWRAIKERIDQSYQDCVSWDAVAAIDVEEPVFYVRWVAAEDLRAYNGTLDNSPLDIQDVPEDAIFYRVRETVSHPAIEAYNGPLADAPVTPPDNATHYQAALSPVIVQAARDGYNGSIEDAPLEQEDWPEDAKEFQRGTQAVSADADLEQHNSGTYLPRSSRPDEWTIVGLLGQIPVRCDGTVTVGDFVKPDDSGLGTADTSPAPGRSVEALEIRAAYDTQTGYAIVLCLVG